MATTPAVQPDAPVSEEGANATTSSPADVQTPTVNVVAPSGELTSIPQDRLDDALDTGYKQATPQDIHDYTMQQQYGSSGQGLLAGAEGAAQAATFGLSTGLETASGLTTGEAIRGREEVHPIAHGVGSLTGYGLSSLIPGVGEANLISKAGEGAASLAGLAEGAGFLSKVGSSIVKNAAETAIMQGTDEVSKALSAPEGQPLDVGNALLHMSLASALGGVTGTAFGAVPELWKAANGTKLGSFLQSITDKFGGTDADAALGVAPETRAGIEASGVSGDINPVQMAAMSDNPAIQAEYKTLLQSEAGSGLKTAATERELRSKIADSAAGALEYSPEDMQHISSGQYSSAEAGKDMGKIIQRGVDEPLEGAKEVYEKLKQYKSVDLAPDTQVELPGNYNNPYAPIPGKMITRPGAVSKMQADLAELASNEKWTTGVGSSIKSAYNEVMQALPNTKTLGDLQKLISQIGENTNKWDDKPLSRAGQLIIKTLRGHADGIMLDAVGQEEGQAAQASLREAQSTFRQQALKQERLQDITGVKGSISGYGKAILEEANNNSEKFINRIANPNNAADLQFIQDNYPEAAIAAKNHIVANLMKASVDKSANGYSVNFKNLINNINKLSPEAKQFAVPPEAMARLQGLQTITNKLNEMPHNFSNTGRVVQSALSSVSSSAVATISMLMSHNPVTAVLMGGLTKALGRDVPDAARYGLLKFLGSSGTIDAGAFKTAVDFAQHAAAGENLIGKATKALFKAGTTVLPTYAVPTDKDTDRLNNSLQAIQKNPDALTKVGGGLGTYMPDHAQQLSSTAVTAANYLNSIRPNVSKQNPLDMPIKPTPVQASAWKNALTIGQQPLTVLDKIKNGTITPQDMVHLKTMYPGLYPKLSQQIYSNMIESVHKGDSIPYNTRLGLSLFLGQPLDSTMTPGAIMSAQPTPPQGQPGSATMPKQGPKHSMSALGKSNAMYRTPNQSAEADRDRD